MDRESNTHSVFWMDYHLILVIKYRRKGIDDAISIRLREILDYIQPPYNISLQEWNPDHDHVHVLVKAHPNAELSKFITAYKSGSSRLIKQEFPILRKALWKAYFWSRSFCLLTTGGAPIETLKRSIENQGERNH
jgi:putative transposase